MLYVDFNRFLSLITLFNVFCNPHISGYKKPITAAHNITIENITKITNQEKKQYKKQFTLYL